MNGRSLWYKMKYKPFLAMIGGFAIAGVAIGILVFIALKWVEPMSAPEQVGTVQFHAKHFTLWYQKDATGIGHHSALANELQGDLDELVKLLQVDPDLIPDSIDVFIHDSIPAMQSSIAKRKDPESRGYAAPLDLLAGESPRRRLAELVLAFGWGQCGSSLLKQGMALYASNSERNFHAIVAALPERLYCPLPELILMEKRGKFPESIYEQFDSPYSPAYIAFADLRGLLGLSVHGEASLEDIPTLETASFVQFLIETKDGIASVRQAWGRGSTVNLLRRIDSALPEELGMRWHAMGREEGKAAPDFAFLSIYYLLGNGFPDTAWAKCSAWRADDLSQDETALAARCALAVGAFTETRDLVSHLEEGDARDEMQDFLSLYDRWTVTEDHGVRVFISSRVTSDEWPGISEVGRAFGEMIKKFALAPGDLPERISLFLYPDEETRDRGELLVPLSSGQNGAIHLLPGDNVAYQIAEVLPVYAFAKDTYSRLLREGVAMALSSDKNVLVEEGLRLRQSDGWFELSSVDFGMTSERTVAVETGLLMNYIFQKYGGDAVRDIWILTSPLGKYLSFDSALSEMCATTRNEIEEALFSSTLHLDR